MPTAAIRSARLWASLSGRLDVLARLVSASSFKRATRLSASAFAGAVRRAARPGSSARSARPTARRRPAPRPCAPAPGVGRPRGPGSMRPAFRAAPAAGARVHHDLAVQLERARQFAGFGRHQRAHAQLALRRLGRKTLPSGRRCGRWRWRSGCGPPWSWPSPAMPAVAARSTSQGCHR